MPREKSVAFHFVINLHFFTCAIFTFNFYKIDIIEFDLSHI